MVTRLPAHIIPMIEHALELNLYPAQVAYILDGSTWVFNGERASGRTTAHIVRLALKVDDKPLDMNRPEDFSDGWELSHHTAYARNYYRPTFLTIRQKLKDAGIPVRELKNFKEEKTMNTYKVSYWFNGNEGTPDKIAYVETESTDKREINKLGLSQIGLYSKTYQVLVEPTFNVETMHVVQLLNTEHTDSEAWYHDRNGELFVVRQMGSKGKFVTCHLLGNTGTTGYIDPKFCTIIKTFKAEDNF